MERRNLLKGAVVVAAASIFPAIPTLAKPKEDHFILVGALMTGMPYTTMRYIGTKGNLDTIVPSYLLREEDLESRSAIDGGFCFSVRKISIAELEALKAKSIYYGKDGAEMVKIARLDWVRPYVGKFISKDWVNKNILNIA